MRIWHGITMSTQAVIGIGVFQQGVACISFSEKDVRSLFFIFLRVRNGQLTNSFGVYKIQKCHSIFLSIYTYISDI